ncbi:hypothetical protein BDN72DRAFT_866527, partial [Pluteus cervinus]
DIRKILAIQDAAYGTMGYANPFNIDTGFAAIIETLAPSPTVASTSSSLSRAASSSSTTSSLSASSGGPSRTGKSKKSRHKSPYQPAAGDTGSAANQTFRIHTEAFQPVVIPPGSEELVPSPLVQWEKALKSVNVDQSHLVDVTRRGRDDSKFMFPTISALINGPPARQARQFTTWYSIRDACIYRAISHTSKSRPLSYQDWKHLLCAPGSAASLPLHKIFEGPFSDFGIDFSSLQLLPLVSLTNTEPLRRTVWE